MTPFDIAIDVSDNNPKIDWHAAHASGIRIAFVKVIEYPGHEYPTGRPQLAGARAAGIVAIPYGFLRPVNPGPYIREFAARAELAPGMAFALDWEGRSSQTASPAIAEAIGLGLAEIAGRPPLGYWGRPGATPAAPTAKMRGWDRWIPRYPIIGINSWAALPEATRNNPEHWWGDGAALPRFAQYTAQGRVSGVTGLVDRSVAFFASEAAALAWCRGAGPQATTPAATPVAENPSPQPAAV